MITTRRIAALVAVSASIIALGLIAFGWPRDKSAEANHGWQHAPPFRVGYDGIGPDFGWVNVYMHPFATSKWWESIVAIDDWRAHRYEDIWWLRFTDVTAEAQAEVIDDGHLSMWSGTTVGDLHGYYCSVYFSAKPLSYATTFVTDTAGALRGQWNDPTGQDLIHTGYFNAGSGPFSRATVCLNSEQPNNTGTIAHELGHVLGLDHPYWSWSTLPPNAVTTYGHCPDAGLNSIMAYNYTAANWGSLWPPSPYRPTSQDVNGPWICDTNYPSGLDHTYQLGCPAPPYGYGGCAGGATAVPTFTPTQTRTPTRTPTPTFTPTPTPVDIDSDGFLNPQLLNHIGPSNTNTSFDNCPTSSNPAQTNTDGNFYELSAFYAVNDLTQPRSDANGDACDADDDNDGRTDAWETDGPTTCPSASSTTNPLVADTDGDRVLDEVECDLNTDPNSAASKPTNQQCADAAGAAISADTDGDKIKDYIEYCFYNTSPTNTDSDGDQALDGARDGCEVASLNADRIVNSGDQLLLSQEILRVSGGGTLIPNFDLNKDGNLNSGDQLLHSWLMSPPGQCP